MIPPGLCFVSVSERALARQKTATMPRFYWDWTPYLKELQGGSTPATPAVGLIFAVQASLERMRAEGLEAIYQRHRELGQYTRDALQAVGCRLLADPRYASSTVTPAFPPEGVSTPALLKTLLETYNIELAGGQGPLLDKIFRVGHLGYVQRADLEPVFAALEAELPVPRTSAAGA
jgi:aspartate aminotransferase-like enzyme